ncbi:MAG TPA: hypothetical protein VEI97_16605 [bacterium]|nr:hypothetical protein [bacterium]
MEAVQPGYLFIVALLFTFVICPMAIWAGFYWQHRFEHPELRPEDQEELSEESAHQHGPAH